MALHRDIFWIGRQWAVTGFGLQAIDQRLKGAFDIETTHVWDENLTGAHASLRLAQCGGFRQGALGRADALSGAAAQGASARR